MSHNSLLTVKKKSMRMCHLCFISDDQFGFKQNLGLFTVWFYAASRSDIKENWNFINRMYKTPTTWCCNAVEARSVTKSLFPRMVCKRIVYRKIFPFPSGPSRKKHLGEFI